MIQIESICGESYFISYGTLIYFSPAAMSSVSFSSSSSMTSPRRRRMLVQVIAGLGAGAVSTQQVGVDEYVGVVVATVIVMALKKNLACLGKSPDPTEPVAKTIKLNKVILKIIFFLSLLGSWCLL